MKIIEWSTCQECNEVKEVTVRLEHFGNDKREYCVDCLKKASEITTPDTKEEAEKCLTALANAYRGDWSDFDGRDLANELRQIGKVLNGTLTYAEFLEINSIDGKTLNWIW